MKNRVAISRYSKFDKETFIKIHLHVGTGHRNIRPSHACVGCAYFRHISKRKFRDQPGP